MNCLENLYGDHHIWADVDTFMREKSFYLFKSNTEQSMKANSYVCGLVFGVAIFAAIEWCSQLRTSKKFEEGPLRRI